MQEPQGAFEVLIDEMGYNILKLLGLFHRKETVFEAISILLHITFFRLKVCVDAHETCDSSNIFILECFH